MGIYCLKHGVFLGTEKCPECEGESKSPESRCSGAMDRNEQRDQGLIVEFESQTPVTIERKLEAPTQATKPEVSDVPATTFDDDDYDMDPEAQCSTCLGYGWVESLVQETRRYFWDDDGPGECPNCRGSGLASDMWYF